jgi:isopentenyl phosphate kinase
LLPVVYGDVVFDSQRGGTIFSTEDIFGYLAQEMNPERILLAGLEDGVYTDYPECKQLIHEITPVNFEEVAPALSGSAAPDVTGGMASKVRQMLTLVQANPSIAISIFSGEQVGNIKNALLGAYFGSQIHNK